MNKLLESKTKVRFTDCDPFNHLNNSKYIDFFLNAREEQILEAYGFDLVKHTEEEQKCWLVSSNKITYFYPAKNMEELVIQSQLIKFTKNTLLVEMHMLDKNKEQMKAIFWTLFTYFDLETERKTDHSDSLNELFGANVVPLEEYDFDKRCFQLLRAHRKKA